MRKIGKMKVMGESNEGGKSSPIRAGGQNP